MTDKEQIMIDGVDVSVCEAYSKHREGYCGWYTPCEGDSCSYKLEWALDQLKRKEQECEEIKEKYEALKLKNQEGYEIVAELKHECEEQKKERDYFKQIVKGCPEVTCENGGFCVIDIENKRLKQECKKLKETLNSLTRGVVMPMPEAEVIDLTDRYRKALEEIEEVIIPLTNKNPIDNCWTLLNRCDECASKKDCETQSPYFRAKQILDIINKADFGKSERSETRPGESCVEPAEPPIIQEAKGEE